MGRGEEEVGAKGELGSMVIPIRGELNRWIIITIEEYKKKKKKIIDGLIEYSVE